jgi:predicted DNA-binding protein with PD1-like motif
MEAVMTTHTFRLKPGQDLFDEIENIIKEETINAGCILCCVGSLTHASLRLANCEYSSEFEGHFEIVSLTGTVSTNGSHMHISISDGEGRTIGGHLLSGSKIYTTAEIVLALFEDIIYQRELLEDDSGYPELVVHPS